MTQAWGLAGERAGADSASSPDSANPQCASVGAKTRSVGGATNIRRKVLALMDGSSVRTNGPSKDHGASVPSAHGASIAAGGRSSKLVLAVMAIVIGAVLSLSLMGCADSGDGAPGLGEAKLSVPTIGEKGKLRVGVNAQNSPMAGNPGDRILGIDVDIAAAVADQLGLEVDVIDVGTDGAQAIEDDKVDIVLGVEEGDKEDGVWLSTPYMQTAIVLFENGDDPTEAPAVDSSPRIAAQVSSKSAWAVTNIFGDDSLDPATDVAVAFESLADGSVDYVASDAIKGLYAANRQGTPVVICALLEAPTGYCAMAADSNGELQDAVEDALSTIIQNGTLDVIEMKWLGEVMNLDGITRIEAESEQTTNVDEKDKDKDKSEADDKDAEGSDAATADEPALDEGSEDLSNDAASGADGVTDFSGTTGDGTMTE